MGDVGADVLTVVSGFSYVGDTRLNKRVLGRGKLEEVRIDPFMDLMISLYGLVIPPDVSSPSNLHGSRLISIIQDQLHSSPSNLYLCLQAVRMREHAYYWGEILGGESVSFKDIAKHWEYNYSEEFDSEFVKTYFTSELNEAYSKKQGDLFAFLVSGESRGLKIKKGKETSLADSA